MKKFELPILQKLTSSGNTQIWKIWVVSPSDIVVEFGQKDGKMQKKIEHIAEGKNVGKANETSPWEQACSEAESKWNKKKYSGYFVAGTLVGTEQYSPTCTLPMLAQSYDKHSKKIIWPAYAQKKYDGCRAIAIRQADKVTLLSRKGKEFKALPHLNIQLGKYLPPQNGEFALDGELYCHGENFQDIISRIKRDDIHPDSTSIEYHVYDIFQPAWPEWTYQQRLDKLKALNLDRHIKLVETVEVKDETELLAFHGKCVAAGYEGAMIRNKLGLYVNDKRSYDLQKVKTFQTDEFEIVGAEENRGSHLGQCSLICRTKTGNEFAVKPEGTEEIRKQYWIDYQAGLLTGKMLTVKYFELSKDGVPRFPVGQEIIGLAIRDYE